MTYLPLSGSPTLMTLLNNKASIWFSQAGGPSRNLQDKMRERLSADDFGVLSGRDGSNASVNLTGMNAAIAAATREVEISPGDYVISGLPTNITGKTFRGPGKLLVQDAPIGYRQINTYADTDYVIGREYLVRALNRIALGPAGGTAQLKCFMYGDSNAEGYVASGSRNGYLLPNIEIPRLFQNEGVHNVTLTNRGLSGTSWPDLNAIPDLGAATDLFFLWYGTNDAALNPTYTVAQKIATMAANMDAKLSAIRAATYGGMQQLSIVLIGPHATKDQTNGRNEEWYEEVRRVYVAMARKYGCAYFDSYAYLRDARLTGPLMLDSAAITGETINIHLQDYSYQMMQAALVRHLFPRQEHGHWAANNFSVVGSTGVTPLSTKLPIDYQHGYYGETWEFALGANGFPVDGILKTTLNPDNYAVQELIPLAATGRKYTRFAANATAWDVYWAGASVAIPLLNSWVSFGPGYTPPVANRADNGIVTISGAIKSGTTTAFTVIGTLPVGYRPAGYQDLTITTSTGVILGRADPDGSINIMATGDATRMSLAGNSFPAA